MAFCRRGASIVSGLEKIIRKSVCSTAESQWAGSGLSGLDKIYFYENEVGLSTG